jgi:multisubunit Na+/H+ antiporter MnhB subunit
MDGGAEMRDAWTLVGIVVIIALAMLIYYLLFHNLRVEAGIKKMRAKWDGVDLAGVVCILVAAFGMLILAAMMLIRWARSVL